MILYNGVIHPASIIITNMGAKPGIYTRVFIVYAYTPDFTRVCVNIYTGFLLVCRGVYMHRVFI